MSKFPVHFPGSFPRSLYPVFRTHRSASSMTGSLIISVTYGHDVQGRDDPVLNVAEGALAALTHALNPGTFLVVCLSLINLICWLQ